MLYCFRAIANEELTPDLAARIGGAVAGYYRDRGLAEIHIAGDYRLSTSALKQALAGGLAGGGMTVYDCGVLPSGVLAAWGKHKAVPTVMVTASHNPPAWNGVQVMQPDSHIWGPAQEDAVRRLLEGQSEWPDYCESGEVKRLDELGIELDYQQRVTNLAGETTGLKVILDAGGGAAIPIATDLLQALGAEVLPIHSQPDGLFLRRDSEPAPQNLVALGSAVADFGADLGLAFDGDADRLAVVDEYGNFVHADHIIQFLCQARREPGPVVLCAGVSLRAEEALAHLGFCPIPCRWGQTFLGAAIKRHKAVFCAEPNGHYTWPELSLRGDGVATAAVLCAALAQDGRPLSKIVGGMEPINVADEAHEWAEDLAEYAEPLTDLLRQEYDEHRRLHERLFIGTSGQRKLIVRQSPWDSSLRLQAESYGIIAPQEMLAQAKEVLGL